jgi:5'-3' exonuclease
MAGELLTEPVAAEPTTASDALLLVDLSSIVHPLWHVSQSDPNPDATSIAAVDRVRQLASRFPTAAVCCDSGKSFRKELDPTYKAQRPAQDAPLKHQMRLATERLRADGFPVWCIDGFEADDVIATAVTRAMAIEGTRVVIATGDKDLLQLVSERVSVKRVADGAMVDPEGVKAKFGVTPAQMGDYLCLVGDTSDNVIGAKGIGAKRAAELLGTFGTLAAAYDALDKQEAKLPQGILNSLTEFRDRLPTVRQLIALRTDVAIPFEEIAAERTPKEVTPMETIDIPQPTDEQHRQDVAASVDSAKGSATGAGGNTTAAVVSASPQTSKPAITGEVVATTADFTKQLEPVSLPQAMQLANHMHAARMFNGYGSPQAVLSTILAGRELGLQAIASLRAFHVIEGKHSPSADVMRGLVLRSGQAKYFRCVERTAERATFETHRHGEPEPVRLSYTIEEGYTAFKPELPEAERKKKWASSAWGKYPANMVTARAGAMLARLVYPDILFGLYTPEELSDERTTA